MKHEQGPYILAIALLLSGCMTLRGIPDADPPVPEVKPCHKWVIDHYRHTMKCITQDEFERDWAPVLATPDP